MSKALRAAVASLLALVVPLAAWSPAAAITEPPAQTSIGSEMFDLNVGIPSDAGSTVLSADSLWGLVGGDPSKVCILNCGPTSVVLNPQVQGVWGTAGSVIAPSGTYGESWSGGRRYYSTAAFGTLVTTAALCAQPGIRCNDSDLNWSLVPYLMDKMDFPPGVSASAAFRVYVKSSSVAYSGNKAVAWSCWNGSVLSSFTATVALNVPVATSYALSSTSLSLCPGEQMASLSIGGLHWRTQQNPSIFDGKGKATLMVKCRKADGTFTYKSASVVGVAGSTVVPACDAGASRVDWTVTQGHEGNEAQVGRLSVKDAYQVAYADCFKGETPCRLVVGWGVANVAGPFLGSQPANLCMFEVGPLLPTDPCVSPTGAVALGQYKCYWASSLTLMFQVSQSACALQVAYLGGIRAGYEASPSPSATASATASPSATASDPVNVNVTWTFDGKVWVQNWPDGYGQTIVNVQVPQQSNTGTMGSQRTQWADCEVSGWAVLNPSALVASVGCLIEVALRPQPQVLDQKLQQVQTAWQQSDAGLFVSDVLAVPSAAFGPLWSASEPDCGGPAVHLPKLTPTSSSITIHPFSSCNPPFVTISALARALGSFAVLIGGAVIVYRPVARALGLPAIGLGRSGGVS